MGARGDAQIITDGDSLFAIPPINTSGLLVRTGAFGGSGATYIAGGDDTNQLFQTWWWYRVHGVNGRELALSNLTSAQAAGNMMTLGFSEPEGLEAALTLTLTDGANVPARANVEFELQLMNTTVSDQTISVFWYVDVDVEGQSADGAGQDSLGRIRFTDNATGFFAEMLGVNRDAYRVAAHPIVRAELVDAGIDNLGNVGLPFAPADVTAAMQWDVTLGPERSTTLRGSLALNQEAQTCGTLVGDTNGDGLVNLTDLATLLTYFGTTSGATRSQGNFDGDGDVDLADLARLLSAFGTGC